MPKGHGESLLPFANWSWDAMGQRAGRLWKYSKGAATVTIPPLAAEALDSVVRRASSRGERLRLLDMEVWHDRAQVSKDIIVNPDFKELLLSGSGWGAIVPEESLITPEDFFRHYDQGYERTRDGGWVPSQNRGHKRTRDK